MAHGSSSNDHHEEWHWLGDGALRGQDAEPGLGHIVPIEVFNRVFAALLVLTVLTVAASRVNFGPMNTVIAIVIASVKALLVALFFMHLKFEKKVIIMYAIYPLVLLFLLIGTSVMDVAVREEVLPSWELELNRGAKPAPVEHAGESHGSGHSGAAGGHGEGH
jgi:cytochrome c oxidase subunit 4